jgi:hypothetical protein
VRELLFLWLHPPKTELKAFKPLKNDVTLNKKNPAIARRQTGTAGWLLLSETEKSITNPYFSSQI